MFNRRDFLAASIAAAAAGVAGNARAAEGQGDRQIIELRTYHFASAAKQEAFEQFLAGAAIPAFNRAGVKPVGVFKPTATDKPGGTDLIVLLPHDSIASAVKLEEKLAADDAFQKAGAAVLNATRKDAAYTRYESMLLLAMEGFPQVKAPAQTEGRIFELRTYQSHSEERGRNKIEMFNHGEFPIFERAKMPGVFFGGAIAGADLPQLTYMVCHPSQADVKKDWAAFFGDPEWKQLIADESYKDNVSKVVATFLKPGKGSQI